ncbi:hypothetical protein D9M72_571060 [compost metagenome]
MTLFENINGVVMLLSIICATEYPIKTYSVVESISPWDSGSIWPSIVSTATNIVAISGPIYGMIFSKAVIKAIMKAFSTPKISKTIK